MSAGSLSSTRITSGAAMDGERSEYTISGLPEPTAASAA